MRRSIAFILALLIFSNSLYAGIGNALDDFISSNDVLSNISEPRKFKVGSNVGFFGGSMSVRLNNTNLPPLATFRPPELRVSCSGMDFNAGFLSILNIDMIEQLLQQGGASLMWGLLIGLAYSLPTVSHVFEQIQKYVRWIQQLSGNVCEIGKKLGMTLGSQIATGYENKKIEKDIASGSAGTTAEAIKDIFSDPDDYSKSTRGNLIYDAVRSAGMSDDYANWAMSAFGTIEWFPGDGSCSISDPEKVKVTVIPRYPLFENIEDFKNLVYGGKVRFYDCGSSCSVAGFVNATCNDMSIQEENYAGLKDNIRDSLVSIVQKITVGTDVSDIEKETIALATIPNIADMIMYLAIIYLDDPAEAFVEIEQLSEYYAWWLVEAFAAYTEKALSSNAAIALANHRAPEKINEALDRLKANLASVRGDIHRYFAEQRKKVEQFYKNYEAIKSLKNAKSDITAGTFTNKFNKSLGSLSY
ncbi:conjugal transfer protein TraH [Deferribacter abyssi]|uniref:conjugal transfer protein TraH n=1 Tax=Deferribacter abyssi TaxID=213806 RepID=UPI003C1EB25D